MCIRDRAQAKSQRATAYVRPHEFDIERYREGGAGIPVRLSHAYLAGPSAYLELASEDSDAVIEACLLYTSRCV